MLTLSSSSLYTIDSCIFRHFSNWIKIICLARTFAHFLFLSHFPIASCASFCIDFVRCIRFFCLQQHELKVPRGQPIKWIQLHFISWKYKSLIWNETAACQRITDTHTHTHHWMCVNLWSYFNFKLQPTEIHSCYSKPFVVQWLVKQHWTPCQWKPKMAWNQ